MQLVHNTDVRQLGRHRLCVHTQVFILQNYKSATVNYSTTKPWPPVPSDTERVHDLGNCSGQLGLRAGGAKNLWVKKSHRKRVSKLKIATYNVRTLLRDEHIQELEEKHMETRLILDIIGISEVRRPEECFTTLQSGHLLYHSKSNNGQAGVGFLINRK